MPWVRSDRDAVGEDGSGVLLVKGKRRRKRPLIGCGYGCEDRDAVGKGVGEGVRDVEWGTLQCKRKKYKGSKQRI